MDSVVFAIIIVGALLVYIGIVNLDVTVTYIKNGETVTHHWVSSKDAQEGKNHDRKD